VACWGCHSRVAQAVSGQNAHAHLARGLVAFHNGQFAQAIVLAGVKKSIGAGDVVLFGIRHQRTGVQADNPSTARWQGQRKYIIRQGRKPHRIGQVVQGRIRQQDEHAAFCGDLPPPRKGHAHVEGCQIVNQHAVGVIAGGNGPLAWQSLGLGGVEGT